MAQYIPKSVVLAEIERLAEVQPTNEFQPKEQNKIDWLSGKMFAINSLRLFLDTLEVKEVDLEKEIKEQSDKYYSQCEKKLQEMDDNDKDLSFLSLDNFAKYFFELGTHVNNPITATDRGTAEEIIINLKRVEQDYRIDLTKEIGWLRNKVKKGE